MKHPYMGSEPLGLPLCMRRVDYSLLPVGTPLPAGTLPGGGSYVQAAGSGQTEETVQTSASTVARWAFVANLSRIGLLADGGIGLVLEPPRTNILLRSTEFDNAQWAKLGGSNVNANATTSPTGASDADTSTAGAGYWQQGQACSVSVPYTGSVYVRGDGAVSLGLLVTDTSDGAPTTNATFVLSTSYQRLAVTLQGDATMVQAGILIGQPVNFQAGHTYAIWQGQTEQGRYATNPIITAGTAASRAGFRVSIPISRYVVGGAFRAQISHVPWADCTAYNGDSATVRLWTIDANTYAEINTTTRVLTVCVNGVSRVAAVPVWWLSGHRIEWYWRVGNGVLFVRYRLSTDKGVSYTLPFDPFAGVQYTDAAISTSATSLDLWSDGGSSKWFGTGACKEDFLYTAPAWALQALPTDVASVKAFFRADSSYTLSTGVSAWASLAASAGLGLSQGVGANQPPVSLSGGPGGRPALSFDGVNDSLVGALRSSYFNTTDGEILCGVRIDAATLGGAGAYFNFHGIVADNSGALGLHYRTAGVTDAGNYTGTGQSAQGSYTLGQWTSLRWQHSGGNVSIGTDAAMGSLTSVASGATTLTGALLVGAGAVGRLTGLITDVIVCDAALTAPQLAIIRSYLTARGLP